MHVLENKNINFVRLTQPRLLNCEGHLHEWNA